MRAGFLPLGRLTCQLVEFGEQPLVSKLFLKDTRIVFSVLIPTIGVTCNSFGVSPMKMGARLTIEALG